MTLKTKTVILIGCAAAALISSGCARNERPPSARTTIQAAPQPTAKEPVATNGNEALAALQRGNDRFVGGTLRHENQGAERRKELTGSQHPFATILSCSDSRVPPELLFDQGLGDLFVVRVAGNFAAVDDLGSIEYAVDHLHTPLVMVLGHESCGAVTAALLPASERAKESKEIQSLLTQLLPSVKGIDPTLANAQQVSLGVEANVRANVARLQANPDLKEHIAAGQLQIVGGVYELESGKVRMLD